MAYVEGMFVALSQDVTVLIGSGKFASTEKLRSSSLVLVRYMVSNSPIRMRSRAYDFAPSAQS